MNKIALLIQNQKEKTVLEHYFQTIDYQVLVLKSNFTAYREISSTLPFCIICEMPTKYLDSIYVIRLLGSHLNTKNIPVIAYGNHSTPSVIESLYDSGVHLYYQRPLQTKELLEDIQTIQQGKSIKIKRYSLVIDDGLSKEETKNKAPKKQQQPPQKTTVKQPIPSQIQTEKKEENVLTVPQDELEAAELVMDPITTPEERIEIIISRVKELLAFPFTIIKILEITNNDQTGAHDLSKAIEADPVIVSTLLSVSNTVHFARRGKRISDVKEAIVRLGFVETKNIAISLSVMNLFSTEAKSVGFNRFEFWYHSLACGIISEIVARKAGYQKPEIAFICGLLHDFGIILLDEFFHSFFLAVFSEAIKNKTQFVTEEKRLWGMSHNTAIGQLFKGWNMPDDVTSTISQLDIFDSMQSVDRKHQAPILVNVIGFSNVIAKSFQFGKDCDAVVYPVSNRTLEHIKISEGIGIEFINTCVERLNIYSEFFSLDKRFFSYPPEPEEDAHIINYISHTKDLFNPHKFYFQTSGYKITEESSVEEIKKLDEQPHAILHLIDNTTPKKQLDPFLTLQNSNLNNIPSIFIAQNDRADLSFESIKHAYMIPSVVDANLLSFIVEGLISQQTIKEYNQLIGTNGSYPQGAKNLTIQYLSNQTVLINLKGVIRLSNFNDIKRCLMKMVDKKVANIAIHIGDIEYIDKLLINLLANFEKKITENDCKVCFCSIGKESPESILKHKVLKSIYQFNKESEVATHF